MDVVVVTAEDLEEPMLPAGNRREPLGALRRADAVVVREEEFAAVAGRVRGLVRVGAPVWLIRRSLVVGKPIHGDGPVMDEALGLPLAIGAAGAGEPTAWGLGAKGGPPRASVDVGGVVAFCGIARPEGFFAMLRAAGVRVVAEIPFPDHYRYTSGDVSRLVDSCHLGGGRGFVMTAKDAVKFGPELRAALEAAGPVHVARLAAEFVDAEGVVCALEARLG